MPQVDTQLGCELEAIALKSNVAQAMLGVKKRLEPRQRRARHPGRVLSTIQSRKDSDQLQMWEGRPT
jgi:hypothetical protein